MTAIDWTEVDETVAAELRARGIETDLDDAQLVAYATSARQEIAVRGFGPLAAVNFVQYGAGSLLALWPPAASVSTVIEEGVALTAGTDYRLRGNGVYLERLVYGYPSSWRGRVTGTIAASVSSERYDRVVVDLIKLALEYSGLDSRRDGDYAEEAKGARGGGQRTYQDEREALIAELAPAGVAFA